MRKHDTGNRVCRDCGTPKPESEYHPRGPGLGARGQCKDCANAAARARRRARRGAAPATPPAPTGEHKWCPSCHNLRDLAEFVRDASRRDGLSTACRRCRARRWRDYTQRKRRTA